MRQQTHLLRLSAFLLLLLSSPTSLLVDGKNEKKKNVRVRSNSNGSNTIFSTGNFRPVTSSNKNNNNNRNNNNSNNNNKVINKSSISGVTANKNGNQYTSNGSIGGSSGGGGSLQTQWLQAHNRRREKFHRQKGKNPVMLEWSTDLERSAQSYANKLLQANGCSELHGYKGDEYGGENLAANWGRGMPARTPEEVVYAWWDKEVSLPYGQKKYHFIQAAWRATRYIGCGQSHKKLSDGADCWIQVCRYLRPGICDTNSGNYLRQMLEDSTGCGPVKPRDK